MPRRLLHLIRPHRGRLAVAFSAVAGWSLLSLAPWRAVRHLIDAIVPGGDPRILTFAALALVGVFAAQALARAASRYLLASVGERVVADLRVSLYRHLQRQSLGFFATRRTGELLSRLTHDVEVVRGLVTDDSANALAQVLVFVGALVLLTTADWRLALAMLALVPVVMLLGALVGRRLRGLSTAVQDELAAATTVVEETLGGVRVVQAFGRQDHEVGRYGDAVERAFGVAMRRARLLATFSPLMTFLFGTATAVVLWLGGREVLAGHLTPGQLVEFIGLTMIVAGAIAQLGGLWTQLQKAVGASKRLFELLDEPPTITDSPSAKPLPAVRGEIAFEGIHFRYGAAEDGPSALEAIDLRIEPGEVLALVGPSGAGKTTLLHLIPRFYDPTAGRVLIDGRDVRSATLESLRSQIGLVPQETHLFGGTVRENILYGRLDATDREMVAAARAANIHDAVARLPEGYETVVGERGVRLSGGERQRIAIARAILEDARILLLDEATSSLDSAGEALVREALARLMRGRTTVVIAHRLSTVVHADRIAVLDGGRLVELGDHRQLLDRGGLYARLVDLQLRPADGSAAVRPGG